MIAPHRGVQSRTSSEPCTPKVWGMYAGWQTASKRSYKYLFYNLYDFSEAVATPDHKPHTFAEIRGGNLRKFPLDAGLSLLRTFGAYNRFHMWKRSLSTTNS